MIQDYFSLDKKGNNYLLLRIINKVDFEEEVVWARDFSLSDRTGISKPVEQLIVNFQRFSTPYPEVA